MAQTKKGKKGFQRKDGGWQCKYCSCMFPTRKNLQEHIHNCEVKLSDYKIDKLGKAINQGSGGTCQFCNRISPTNSGLTNHIKYCKLNPNHIIMVGHKHTDETKIHLVEIASKRIGFSANFNKTACEYIDKINQENGWNLQHALNGGEITIGPYFLDGYDKDRNIAFEYDEPAHYKNREHDLLKQKYIIEKIHCEFWRYDEGNNILYKVCDGFQLKDFEVKKNKIVKSSKKKIKKHKPTLDMRTYREDFKSLEEERWQILQNSNIDFSKFGWVKEISKLFGIAENKAGKYIKKHFPLFYKEKCYKRNN